MKLNTKSTYTPSIVYESNPKNISGRRPSQEPGSVSTGCSALRARGRGGHRSPGELASLARWPGRRAYRHCPGRRDCSPG